MSSTSSWGAARLDIGQLKAPTDDALAAGFMEASEPVDAIADAGTCSG
jgi:hypothetical protein